MKQSLFFGLLLLVLGCGQNKSGPTEYQVPQKLTTKQIKFIDSLTAHWNQKDKPGGAIALIKDGNVIYKSALGYSNVSAGEMMKEETGFQLGQISDSFVAYALLHLENNSTLSLDDKLSHYLPFLTSFGNDIKVKHLLQHSSGIHDFEILKNIVGWSDSRPFSKDDALRLIQTQGKVSFVPGSEFSFSRSNMLLASMVVESKAKVSFEEYVAENIFKPLEMNNTLVLTETNQKSLQMAISYQNEEDESVIAITPKKETYAGINIVSSISDMVKWEQHLYNPEKEGVAIVEKFNSHVKLDNGKMYKVPAGTLIYGQKYIHKERGVNTAMSTGGIDGFASAIFNFPSENFTTITLSNNGEPYNGYIGMLSAHNIIAEAFTEPITTDYATLKTVPLDKEYHQNFEGTYWDALGELSRQIRIENDTLHYIRSNGFSAALIPLSKDRFQMKTAFDDKIYLTFYQNDDGRIGMKYFFGEATPFVFVKYSPVTFSDTELQNRFAGPYYCEALDVIYKFTAKDGKLQSSHNGQDTIHFTPIFPKLFQGDQWYMGSIEFQTDNQGTIKGFYVRNDAIRNLWFEKR